MPRSRVRSLLALIAALAVPGVAATVLAGSGPVTHVCAPDEGKGVCPLGRARSCDSAGSLAGCVCPPGASASGSAACSADASAPRPTSCVVPATALGASMGAQLELGELAAPRLASFAPPDAAVTVATLDAKVASASADELVKLALAHEALEGEAAAEGATLNGGRRKASLARRDLSVGRAIAARQALRARFPGDARLAAETLALARAHLRRKAYGASPTDVADRELARRLLEEITTSKATGRALRDAAFALAEESARDHAWSRVVALEAMVLSSARASLLADDPAYVAAALARTAQARLETGDLNGAKGALFEAIAAGVPCEPRSECVQAAAAARFVLPSLFAALGEPARALAPILSKGAMPRAERARPLLKLADVYAAAPGSACAAAAEEARGWAQIVR